METQTLKTTQLIFEENIRLTGIAEYGVSWEDLNAGKEPVPSEGARFDLSFEGDLNGSGIRGKVKGVDYMTVRSDGKFLLRLHAVIVTDDGESIALEEDGILLPEEADPQYADLQLNIKFTAASSKYSWLNKKLAWGIGRVDRGQGTIYIQAYSL
jgi:hypothetical protein